MSYKVESSDRFDRDIKKLAKKYKSLKSELTGLIDSLERNPSQGISLGKGCYKIRLGLKSKGVGKSGGARVITYVVTEDEQVVLLTIYDKKDKVDLTPGELAILLGDI